MKTSIFSIALVAFLFCCKNKNEFTIKGSFTGEPTEEWVYLVKFMGSDPDADSARIINGKFEFKGTTEFPEVYGISYHPSKAVGICPIFLEPADLKVVIDLEVWDVYSSVSGGKINDEYNRLQNFDKEIMKLYADMSDSDGEQLKKIESEIEGLSKKANEQKIDYIRNNPGSPISIFLYSWMERQFSLEEKGELLNRFSPEIQSTTIFQSLNADYHEAIGPETSTTSLVYDSEIRMVESDLKGQPIIQTLLNQNPEKHLFVDIWGTWCGPCIEEFPSTRALKSTLDSTDITFVYMCLDCEEDQWKNMIVKEDLKGLHYSVRKKNLTRFYNETGDKRRGVPKYLVINKDGTVVSGNAPKPSSGKLEEMLKNL